MRERGINTRILSELMEISKSTAQQWERKGKIPTEYLPALRAIRKKQSEPKRKWIECDIEALRDALGANKTDMADLLETSTNQIFNWEGAYRIPRTLMPRINELKREAQK